MDESERKELESYASIMADLTKKEEETVRGLELRFNTLYDHRKLAVEILSLARSIIDEFNLDKKEEMAQKALKLKMLIIQNFEPIMKDEQEFVEKYAKLAYTENRYSKAQQVIFTNDYRQLKDDLSKSDMRGKEATKILSKELNNVRECIKKEGKIQNINEYLGELQKNLLEFITEIKRLVLQELAVIETFIFKEKYLATRDQAGREGTITKEDIEEAVVELKQILKEITEKLIEEKRKILDPLKRAIKDKEDASKEVEGIITGSKGRITMGVIKNDLRKIATRPEEMMKYAAKLLAKGEYFYPEEDRGKIEKYLEKVISFAQYKKDERERSLIAEKSILEKEAGKDHLTQLKNKRAFEEELEKQISEAERYKQQFSLAMIDIDDFKQFNDIYGHLVGDEVLRFVAKIIKDSIRKEDDAYRYGGEEMAVIFPLTNKEGAIRGAEHIRRQIYSNSSKKMREINDKVGVEQRMFISVSMGVSTCPEDGEDKETMINEADQALYKSKKEGKNRVTAAGGYS